jgi:hypothetical protein
MRDSGFQHPVQSNGSGFDYPGAGSLEYDYSQPASAAPGALVAGNNLGLAPVFGGAAPLAGPTGLGALLKDGRYRIIQPFSAQSGAVQPENEAPLLVAQDTEAPNTEVLIQEMRFDGTPPQDAEYARYLTAQRLISLSYLPGYSRLVDSFSDHNHQYLVFEYPSGDLLSDRLRRVRGPLPETTAIGITLQLLDVLIGAEHERPPFIHGNLCPGNVVLRPSGQLTLVGMSPTLLLYPEGESASGPAGGVAGYSAPEQSRGQASMRSDLLAVCAILYQAVTGSPPYTRASAVVQPAHRLNPAVSLELEEILNKGMRPSPAQRYQTVAELREALAPLALGRHVTYAATSEALEGTGALALERAAELAAAGGDSDRDGEVSRAGEQVGLEALAERAHLRFEFEIVLVGRKIFSHFENLGGYVALRDMDLYDAHARSNGPDERVQFVHSRAPSLRCERQIGVPPGEYGWQRRVDDFKDVEMCRE